MLFCLGPLSVNVVSVDYCVCSVWVRCLLMLCRWITVPVVLSGSAVF